MFNAHQITVSFGGETLFDEISFRLGKGDRVGLIGKNGAGKSTLLKLMAQENAPTSGTFALEKNCKIGYLPQDLDFENGRSVLEEAYLAFDEIKKIEYRQEEIHNIMENTQDYESQEYYDILDELNELSTRYEMIGGYHYQAQTEKILLGLGFSVRDLDAPTDTFSGGWRMRIELAKLLLKDNDILLLDEPTNHLDIESIIWLEQFLKKFKGALVLVSHDRMFLDQVTNRTVEIVQQRIFDFKKSYSKYMVLRQELRAQQQAAQKNQEKEIQQTEKLIERFRAKASKASMAQSLIKKLDKINRIEIDPEENKKIRFEFGISHQPGKIILEVQQVSKAYGDKQVLSGVDLEIERGEKIAFVGQNGQGKSTLAKILVSEIQYDGKVKLGHNVQLGYFAQNQSTYLDGEQTVLQSAEDSATPENRTKVRDLLGSFLFPGEAVDKKVKVLSGGERNRLALCKLLLQPFNVLIMDEPTNHLDIGSKNVLKEALLKFQGTLILVSHDRDFVQGLCKKVIAFKDGEVTPFLGDINAYLEAKKLASLKELEIGTKEKIKTTSKEGGKTYEEQKQSRAEEQKILKVEKQISRLEKEIKAIDFELEINYEETIAQANFFDSYQAKKKQLEELMQEWEALQL
ncbi:ABC-F family ATP-binding cassette domain-containing protein [Flavobacteriaceae bacterium]|jgi:ATP-binding cassette subfamily F protein 3|nr:ABC-F family ATP-binding cassette domain-containing protein [Flavobacteriaceae bacterium]MDA9003209.1 ABC-F family ATP-binding cassette domain-containing protein [Flavobacteriaceae bacterium]MDA9878847.1 ABC-F family ATP-binding cassette domain-containing protein [Flavobacteriaceae bacterium]MDB2328101.1 ABC-F family ATP-binding cassette domain-containing protein [Flavobacteriaceae bacterium]